VRDPALVRRRQATRDLYPAVHSLVDRQALPAQPLPQRLPLEQLLDDVVDLARNTDVEEGQDVRVTQRRRRPRLLLEAPEAVLVGSQFRWDNLDRHVTAQARVSGPVNLTHAPGPDQTEHLVGAESNARAQTHGRSSSKSRGARTRMRSWESAGTITPTSR
jgi:hypothetical protein